MSSALLDLSFQACPFPASVDFVTFAALMDQIDDPDVAVSLVDLYVLDRGTAESMIELAIRCNVVFDCPVCNNQGTRQVWIDLNDSSRVLCSVPCYCQNKPSAPIDCTDGLKI